MKQENESTLLRANNTNCAGCGMSVAINFLGDALGSELKFAIPACCGIVTPHAFPYSAYKVPAVATCFASAAAVASGMSAIRDLNGEDHHVVALAGDGGTFDIGMATLSASAERNENFIYVCYDNEVYGNTGAQRSSATPLGAATTTTPYGKRELKKDIVAILAQHNVPYAATASIGYPEDMRRKILTAAALKGFRFLHVLSPCVPNWKIEPAQSIALARLAVETGVFPLYEVFRREEYRITVKPDRLKPIDEYLGPQKRFAKADASARAAMQLEVNRSWERLLKLEEAFPPGELAAHAAN